jgi:hypothetical protein
LIVGGEQAADAPMVAQLASGALGLDGVSYGAGSGNVLVEGVWSVGSGSNMTAYEEMDAKTFGNTADVDVSGPAVQFVMKSGGNQFHGRFIEVVQHERFASENIDDRLRAQGIVVSDSVVWYNDLAADLGRLIRDKLWFYGNLRDERSKI